MKKRLVDRYDAKRIKTDGLFNLIYYIKPSRSVSEVYINKKYDVTSLVKYMEALKKESNDYTYFHLFCTAIAKLVYNKKSLNRFLMKSKFYQREDVTLSFVAKVDFNESSEETNECY